MPTTMANGVSPAPNAEASHERALRPDLVERLAPAISVVCWFYLSIVICLFAWVVGVQLLVGWTPTVITSGSMRPAINEGDVVVVAEPDEATELSKGTVITFEDPSGDGGLITHRIDHVNDDGTYVTRGDANGAADSYEVAPDEVTGVGRLLVPAVGLPKLWLDDGRLLMLGGWLAGSLLAVYGALRPVRARSRTDAGDD